MISTSHVVVTARAVRVAASAVAISLLIGFIAISSFSSRYGGSGPVLETRSNETALTAAILELESAGLVCSDRPVPTRTVLFQPHGSDRVQILSFDRAIKASSTREGTIRSYCSGP